MIHASERDKRMAVDNGARCTRSSRMHSKHNIASVRLPANTRDESMLEDAPTDALDGPPPPPFGIAFSSKRAEQLATWHGSAPCSTFSPT